jgi:hypothetical protein
MKTQSVRTVLDSTHLSWDKLLAAKPPWLFFHIPLRDNGKDELQVKVPFRQMASAMEKRLNKVVLYTETCHGAASGPDGRKNLWLSCGKQLARWEMYRKKKSGRKWLNIVKQELHGDQP